MKKTASEEAKKTAKEKLQLALDNLLLAEAEGAEEFTPDTHAWAKQKIYNNKKIMLKHFDDEKLIEEASDDACAAAAQLLSLVRDEKESKIKHISKSPMRLEEKEAIKNLVNEGGRVL